MISECACGVGGATYSLFALFKLRPRLDRRRFSPKYFLHFYMRILITFGHPVKKNAKTHLFLLFLWITQIFLPSQKWPVAWVALHIVPLRFSKSASDSIVANGFLSKINNNSHYFSKFRLFQHAIKRSSLFARPVVVPEKSSILHKDSHYSRKVWQVSHDVLHKFV